MLFFGPPARALSLSLSKAETFGRERERERERERSLLLLLLSSFFKNTRSPGDDPAGCLARAREWRYYVGENGLWYARETNTMPQWAGSCWYYLRFADPKNADALCGAKQDQAWLPVDLYVGGAEHAVLHLLYARFWHKVLNELGLVLLTHTHAPSVSLKSTRSLEIHQIVISSRSYHERFWILFTFGFFFLLNFEREREREKRFPPLLLLLLLPLLLQSALLSDVSQTDAPEPFKKLVHQGMILGADGEKMSKSRGNVVNPDEVVDATGADSLRLYEMFMGPIDAVKPWQTSQVLSLSLNKASLFAVVGGGGSCVDREREGQKHTERRPRRFAADVERLEWKENKNRHFF